MAVPGVPISTGGGWSSSSGAQGGAATGGITFGAKGGALDAGALTAGLIGLVLGFVLARVL